MQTAITAANANTPVGTLKNTKQSLTIQAQTQLSNAAQFRNIIVATRNGQPVRLGDVAMVIELGREQPDRELVRRHARDPARRVQRQPDANTVEVVDQRQGAAAELRKPVAARRRHQRAQRPLHLDPRTPCDDVQFTLALTIALVIMVIFLFLRHVSATIIPALAVPISLIATLGAMYLFGFSHRQHLAARPDARRSASSSTTPS